MRLVLGEPAIEGRRVVCDVTLGLKGHRIWIEGAASAESAYDGILFAFLPMAFRQALDITCEAPVNVGLLRRIQERLIPTLSSGIEGYRGFSIGAPGRLDKDSEPGWSGLGLSCGADSLWSALFDEAARKSDWFLWFDELPRLKLRFRRGFQVRGLRLFTKPYPRRVTLLASLTS